MGACSAAGYHRQMAFSYGQAELVLRSVQREDRHEHKHISGKKRGYFIINLRLFIVIASDNNIVHPSDKTE